MKWKMKLTLNKHLIKIARFNQYQTEISGLLAILANVIHHIVKWLCSAMLIRDFEFNSNAFYKQLAITVPFRWNLTSSYEHKLTR